MLPCVTVSQGSISNISVSSTSSSGSNIKVLSSYKQANKLPRELLFLFFLKGKQIWCRQHNNERRYHTF